MIWIHAVSVGEVESSVPLVERLRSQYPARPLLITTTTPTGSGRVRALYPEGVEHCYLPYDLPGPLRRFFEHFRPSLAIVLETEIWPNLCARCLRDGVPLVIANARLSERSSRGYRRVRGLVARSLSAARLIAAQSPADADRFASLGAAAQTLKVIGNIKFDKAFPTDLKGQGQAYRTSLFSNRPIWIAASTHEDEERRMLEVHSRLRERFPGLVLVLAPRHPERFGQVAELSRSLGFGTTLRSQQIALAASNEVFVLDSLGELRAFYAAAHVAFVGGSLVPVGGHNVLEPAVAGIPVIFGPHVNNFRDICSRLLEAGGAIQVTDECGLADALQRLLADSGARAALSAAGLSFVSENRGSVERLLALLTPYLA